jgi:hypothetical protein
MTEQEMTQIPLWVVASIGKQIALTTEFQGPVHRYAAGSRGKLLAIMVDEDNYQGKPYAIVALDPNDESDMENFPFKHIRPLVDRVKFSLNIERGIIAF